MGILNEFKKQAIEEIKKALEVRNPSKTGILKYLYKLQANISLSKFEFFDIIGIIIQIRPEFFMTSIYPKMWRKFAKIYGIEGIRVMDKYILENFCLNQGEQIIYEFNGTIKQNVPRQHSIQVSGNIYVTNNRIIAQGIFLFFPRQSVGATAAEVVTGLPLGRDVKKPKKTYIYHSAPCYGYKFPTDNLSGLQMQDRKLSYFSVGSEVTIIPPKNEVHGDKLYAIFDKFQD